MGLGTESFEDRLRIVRQHDPEAEELVRAEIREYMRAHRDFTAKFIACTGDSDQWKHHCGGPTRAQVRGPALDRGLAGVFFPSVF